MQKRIQPFFVFILVIIVSVSFSCNKERTTLSITATPANPTTQTDIRFESSQDGSGWKFSWNFGDGDFNTTNTYYANHRYSQPGVYNVMLSVEHNGNPLGTCSVSVTVQ